MQHSILVTQILLASLQGFALAGEALGQDTAAPAEPPLLAVELNLVEQHEKTCRLTFVAQNTLGGDLLALVFETVLFDRAGQVIDLTLFDFQDLPDGSPRVRQFDLADVSCASIGRVLFNDVHACTSESLTPEVCATGLRWSSRTGVEVLG